MPHDGPGEHYHDTGERIPGSDETVVWTTVGFDVGSSTSQAVFSRITLARQDAFYVVVDRAILHQSDIFLTPYAAPEHIDEVRLGDFVDREFAAAGLARQDIDAGAVIMTGLALSTGNARTIGQVIADESGRFVAVSAGDLLEARLAANGAGMAALSADRAGVQLHVDIGGGTTKMSTWSAGRLLRAAAIDVGARLLTVDASGCIARIEPPIARLAAALNLELRIGDRLSSSAADALAGSLAAEILRCGGVLRDRACDPALLRTSPLFDAGPLLDIETIVFSGGVSEYIYRRERRDFGDLGIVLGGAVRDAVAASKVPLLDSDRGIRATVLGASQHSVQLSGNTIYVSDASCLPLRSLPVLLVAVDLSADPLDAQAISREFDQALRSGIPAGAAERGIAFAICWRGSPTFQRLDAVARALVATTDRHLEAAVSCIVLVEGDVAGLLGAALDRLWAGRRVVICLDGVHVHEFDHVDIGAMGLHTRALPVVVKSLLFNKNAGAPHVHH